MRLGSAPARLLCCLAIAGGLAAGWVVPRTHAAAVTSCTGVAISATQGATFNGLVASVITSGGVAIPIAEFHATITWNDSSTSAGIISVDDFNSLNLAVSASHTFATAGTQSLTISISHYNGINVDWSGSASSTVTVSAAPAGSATATPAATATLAPSSTPTRTPTATFTNTATATNSPTATATNTATATSTPTLTPTNSPTATASTTRTPTPSFTLTLTPSPTASPTKTASPSATRTVTSTLTRTASPTASRTATRTFTPTPTRTSIRTFTRTPTRTATRTPTRTPTRTLTRTPIRTAAPTRPAGFRATAIATRAASPRKRPASPTGTRNPTKPTPRATPHAPATGAIAHAPSLTVRAPLRVRSGGVLTFSISTSARAQVHAMLRVVVVIAGKAGTGSGAASPARTSVPFQAVWNGRADARGHATAAIKVTYRSARPVKANLAVSASAQGASAGCATVVTIDPPRTLKK